MTIVRTAFAPRQHGLRFENAFSYQVHLLAHLPVGRPFAFGLCGGVQGVQCCAGRAEAAGRS